MNLCLNVFLPMFYVRKLPFKNGYFRSGSVATIISQLTKGLTVTWLGDYFLNKGGEGCSYFIYRVNPTGDVSKCQTKHPTPDVAWNVSVRLRLFVYLLAPWLFFKARLQGSRQGPLLQINKITLFTSPDTFILERTLYLTSHLIHKSAYIY